MLNLPSQYSATPISGCLSSYFQCKECLINNDIDVGSQYEYSFILCLLLTSISFNLNYGIYF